MPTTEHKGEYETWRQPEMRTTMFHPAGSFLPNLPSYFFVSFVIQGFRPAQAHEKRVFRLVIAT